MTKGLGKGLSALFSETEEAYENAQNQESEQTVNEINIEDIYANPDQPRKNFDESAMEELASSIREHGVITPIVLTKGENGKYMIIAGERRYRAAKRAGLYTIPAVVRDYSDREVKEISLIENLQREDLNPIEAAVGMKKLMDDYKLTQDELAQRIGKSRPAIANTLRLLTLCDEVIDMVRDGKLSSGHARALVPLPKEVQPKIAQEAIDKNFSVREIERAVKAYLTPPDIQTKKKDEKIAQTSYELKHFIERMRSAFGTKVSLIGNEKKGRIYIDYYTADDLDRLSEILDIINRQE